MNNGVSKVFDGKSVVVIGANGFIGSALIYELLNLRTYFEVNLEITAIFRGIKPSSALQLVVGRSKDVKYVSHDINESLQRVETGDYIINCASPANPISFAVDPVGTMRANLLGMSNVLDYATKSNNARVLYVSSGEVYGQSVNNESEFKESSAGYIDILDPRSCYPSSKRAAETLCAAFVAQYDADVVIARPCHIYGPNPNEADSRVVSQFIRRATSGNDIIMKSRGEQVRSYCYIKDAVSAIMQVLIHGTKGEAYNIANRTSTLSIYEFAQRLASLAGCKIVFDVPDELESKGYTKVTRSVLDPTKIENLGWKPRYSIEDGLAETLVCMNR